jgi:hypothetical protein
VPTKAGTETKEEAKAVVNTTLLKSYKEWMAIDRNSTSKFADIVELCIENELSRATIKATLFQSGLYKNEQSANTETSVIVRCMQEKNRDKLEAALDGKITIRDLRSPRTLEQIQEARVARVAADGTKAGRNQLPEDPEKQIGLKLKGAAKIYVLDAIAKEEEPDKDEFLRLAREQYQEQKEKLVESKDQGEAEEYEDDEGRRVNAEGHLIDDDGNLIDDDGNLVDEQDRPIDDEGNLIETEDEEEAPPAKKKKLVRK